MANVFNLDGCYGIYAMHTERLRMGVEALAKHEAVSFIHFIFFILNLDRAIQESHTPSDKATKCQSHYRLTLRLIYRKKPMLKLMELYFHQNL